MSPAPIAAPLARIAQIQSRFMLPTAPSQGSGASAADFESALASATAAGGSAPLASGAPLRAGAGSGDLGARAVDIARQYQGVPYLWGGTDPSRGFDCSGLVQHVYGQLGIDLPRVSRDQARAGTEVASLDQARPGDLVAFGRPVDHIGIYIGDNTMIHAPRSGDVVKISEIDRTPSAIRRVVPDSGPAAAPLAAGTGLSDSAGVGGGALAATPALAPYAGLFAEAGARHGISADLLAAVASVESGGNPNAVSSAGASGLMQFMPGTARAMGIDPLDPAQAVDGAARLLVRLRNQFGSVELALAGYNAGEGNVRRHGGVPPFAETRSYVSKVMALAGGAR